METGKFRANHRKEDQQDTLERGDKTFPNSKKWGHKL
jgi:hypothetical protein